MERYQGGQGPQPAEGEWGPVAVVIDEATAELSEPHLASASEPQAILLEEPESPEPVAVKTIVLAECLPVLEGEIRYISFTH